MAQRKRPSHVQLVADIVRLKLKTFGFQRQEKDMKKLMIVMALITGIAAPALAGASPAFAGPRDGYVHNYDRAVNGSDASTPGHN